MERWVADHIAAPRKKPLPVLSFPAVQPMGVTVAELIGDASLQAEAMRLVAGRTDSAAAVSFMDLSVEAEAFGAEVRVSDDEVPTVVGALVDEDSDPDELAVPQVGAGRTGLYLEAIRRVAPEITDRPVLAGVIGPFSLAGRLMDVNEVMVLCYEEPELVHAVLDKATEFICAYAAAFKEAGADGVVMAEPLAGLLPPELMGEFSTPYARRVVDAVQDGTFAVVYHNCGPSVAAAHAEVAAVGAAAYHFGNASDMAEMLELMPDDALVMGNVDPAGEIRNGTPESVREATLALMAACAHHPNFVPSTGCDVPPMSPWANIDAFFAAVAEFYEAR
ncbi:MAG: methyltransferase [Eggerthellaceae bacterium]|nr:methyltransferase [Eggerthellaceae bacterium]